MSEQSSQFMSVGIKDHPSLPIVSIVSIVAIVAMPGWMMDALARKYQLGAAD